jgi:hypothetical protein
MKFFLGVLIALLLILHQDNWYWTDPTLVGGFMPIGLLYHAGISLAAAFVWFLTTIFVWPKEVELNDETPVQPNSDSGAK